MNSEEKRVLQLLEKFQNNAATPDEMAELDLWYESFEGASKLTNELTADQSILVRNRMLNNIKRSIPKRKSKSNFPKKLPRYKIFGIGAMVVSLMVFIVFRLIAPKQPNATQIDVSPGRNTAHLILSNGSIIDLEKAKAGLLFATSNILINKDSAGSISYHFKKGTDVSNLGSNSVVIPAGGQFRVVLSDGTKVWMNAKSKFTYPVSFSEKIRPVNLTGEAYFEVAKNRNKPFLVYTPKQVIKVLGTHFNVNAYEDERTQKTTLLEGLVQITTTDKTAKSVVIQPGQQALQDDQVIQIRSVNTDVAAGWKNGLFVFDHTELPELMRQLSRWYNVEVIYRGSIESKNFSGEIERGYTLNETLRILELGNVHFRIEKPITKGGQKRLIINQ